jgi:hypothetical protein
MLLPALSTNKRAEGPPSLIVALKYLLLTTTWHLSFEGSRGQANSIAWTSQFGTSASDRGQAVSADRLGSVYVSGYTEGSLGDANMGGQDAYLSKYDATGVFQWTRQLGTSSNDRSHAVSADGIGNVYISGFSEGSLGAPSAGASDAFLSKYDDLGALRWTRQLGTAAGDFSYGVSADRLGNVFVSGFTAGSLGGPNAGNSDAFISKYDATGGLHWTRQIGSNGFENSLGACADNLGNVYITGYTDGFLATPYGGGVDAYLAKYDTSGTLLWTRQLGTSTYDWSGSVSADTLGNVYIAGVTRGNLGGPTAGPDDAFVSKYDSAGNLQWTRQFGTSDADGSYGVSADDLGVYVTGTTGGSLGGTNAGARDAFVAKYDATGALLWMRQLGTPALDEGYGVSADGHGSAYITGVTFGNLAGQNNGLSDGFVTKIEDIPEPTSWSLVIFAAIAQALGLWRDKAQRFNCDSTAVAAT